MKLVVKPDCLFGKRGKHDLVGGKVKNALFGPPDPSPSTPILRQPQRRQGLRAQKKPYANAQADPPTLKFSHLSPADIKRLILIPALRRTLPFKVPGLAGAPAGPQVGLNLDYTGAEQFIKARMNKVRRHSAGHSAAQNGIGGPSGGLCGPQSLLGCRCALHRAPKHPCWRQSCCCPRCGESGRAWAAWEAACKYGTICRQNKMWLEQKSHAFIVWPCSLLLACLQVVDMDGTVGKIDCFIIEPFVPHDVRPGRGGAGRRRRSAHISSPCAARARWCASFSLRPALFRTTVLNKSRQIQSKFRTQTFLPAPGGVLPVHPDRPAGLRHLLLGAGGHGD